MDENINNIKTEILICNVKKLLNHYVLEDNSFANRFDWETLEQKQLFYPFHSEIVQSCSEVWLDKIKTKPQQLYYIFITTMNIRYEIDNLRVSQ